MDRQVQDHPVYAAMVEAMDQAVGKVLGEIDKLNLQEKTIVIFMSDNGGLSTSEGSPTSNLPLRAGKGWLYEGGIREPMIIKWPETTKPASICEVPVISTDFYPTMLDMAGFPKEKKQTLDGRSLVPLLKGKTVMKREALYWHYPHYGNQGGSPSAAIRMGDYKLIGFYEDNHLELYNLKSDIGEQNNLAKADSVRAEKMRTSLRSWQKKIGAKFPTLNPNWKR